MKKIHDFLAARTVNQLKIGGYLSIVFSLVTAGLAAIAAPFIGDALKNKMYDTIGDEAISLHRHSKTLIILGWTVLSSRLVLLSLHLSGALEGTEAALKAVLETGVEPTITLFGQLTVLMALGAAPGLCAIAATFILTRMALKASWSRLRSDFGK